MPSKVKGFNVNSFVEGNPEEKDTSMVIIPELVTEPAKPKRTRKSKFEEGPPENNKALVASNSMSYIQQNIPYQNAYDNTNKQLDETINQLNALSIDAMNDLQLMRANKTLKNKYMTIGNLIEQNVSIINAKLNAIKEKNKVINDVNNLEIKRLKDLKMDASQEDADVKLANMYHAFVNTPIGANIQGGVMGAGLAGALGPSQNAMLMYGNNQQNLNYGIIPGDNMDASKGLENMSPAQRRMFLQAQNIMETVVVYDENTGSRRYAAINKSTGQEIPGVELPNPETIYELDVNTYTKTAKDSSRNVVYPVIINNSNSINMY